MKVRALRLAAALAFYVPALILLPRNFWLGLGLIIVSYLIAGYDVVWLSIKSILRGNLFDENFLMSLATIGAFAIGEYPEAVAVMLFYQVGELFQSYALDKSRKSIGDLMNIRPDYANVLRDGVFVKVDPDEVAVGDTLEIRPGERVPLDAVVLDGYSSIDTSALTGEAAPRDITPGMELLSGTININGLLKAQVTKEFEESTVNKVLELVENASARKASSERFITKFAKVYTPIVVILATLLAVVPPLIIPGADFTTWLYRALTFLVVSCPCALVISIPLAYFGGIGGASHQGVLVKGGNYLEALANTSTIVFDKTGTLTKGVFKVQGIYPASEDITPAEILEAAAYAESASTHPIARSILEAYQRDDIGVEKDRITSLSEIPGHGIEAHVDGHKILAGNAKLMARMNIPLTQAADYGTQVFVVKNQDFLGHILIADEVKDDAIFAIKHLREKFHQMTVLLTGDVKAVGEKIGHALGVDNVYTDLLPGDKVTKLEEVLAAKASKATVAFVGDGINDAPSLARADVGIAMGGIGSDAAIEAADVVLMTDEPSKIITAIKIARKTRNIATQNIIFALGIKVLVLILTAFGLSTMWEAVFADVGVAVIAILNSMRVLRGIA